MLALNACKLHFGGRIFHIRILTFFFHENISILIYTIQNLIEITFYVSNFAVQMYKFMTGFALRILNIIFRCNSCISVLTKVHTFHTANEPIHSQNLA